MSGIVKPTGVTVDRQTRELTLKWNDGHESVYAFYLLRYACPCAECQGGHENMRPEPDNEVFALPVVDSPATRVQDVESVNYDCMGRWSPLRDLYLRLPAQTVPLSDLPSGVKRCMKTIL